MSKAKNIAQTEQVGALRQAQWNETDWAADRLGLNTGLLWLSALKPTTRTWHASRHGKVYTTEEVRDFYAENGKPNTDNTVSLTVAEYSDAIYQ